MFDHFILLSWISPLFCNQRSLLPTQIMSYWLSVSPLAWHSSLCRFSDDTPLQPTAVDGPPVTWSKSNTLTVTQFGEIRTGISGKRRQPWKRALKKTNYLFRMTCEREKSTKEMKWSSKFTTGTLVSCLRQDSMGVPLAPPTSQRITCQVTKWKCKASCFCNDSPCKAVSAGLT